MGPPERGGDWTDEGVEGVNRFLSRLWRLCEEVEERTEAAGRARRGRGRRAGAARQGALGDRQGDPGLPARLPVQHRDLGGDGAGQRRLPAQGRPLRRSGRRRGGALRHRHRGLADLPLRAAPRQRGLRAADRRAGLGAALARGRPGAARQRHRDPDRPGQRQAARPDRGAGRRAPQEELLALARASEKVGKHLDGKEIVKEIVVPGKLVNLVVR